MDKLSMVFQQMAILVEKFEQRPGQALFNAALHFFPKAAEIARGDIDLDPFHIDENMGNFILHLQEVGE